MIFRGFFKFYAKKFIINSSVVKKLWKLVGLYLSIVSTILQKGIKKFVLELQKRALCLQKKSVNAGVGVALVRYATIGGSTLPAHAPGAWQGAMGSFLVPHPSLFWLVLHVFHGKCGNFVELCFWKKTVIPWGHHVLPCLAPAPHEQQGLGCP